MTLKDAFENALLYYCAGGKEGAVQTVFQIRLPVTRIRVRLGKKKQ
jgi:hypothetical protein